MFRRNKNTALKDLVATYKECETKLKTKGYLKKYPKLAKDLKLLIKDISSYKTYEDYAEKDSKKYLGRLYREVKRVDGSDIQEILKILYINDLKELNSLISELPF